MSRYSTVNPATGEIVATFGTASDSDIADALTRTQQGYEVWRNTELAQRVQVLHEIARVYRARSEQLARLIGLEMGKPYSEALGEIEIVASIFDYYANEGPAMLDEEVLNVAGGGSAFIRTKPVGSVLGIMPWNYPHYQVARFVAPNILLGNSVMLKHAPNCPQNALSVVDIVREAGLPDDVYINVFATPEQVKTIIADDRNQGVSLTGSERAGSAVAEIAGRHLKKCVLELGGSDAFILLDTNDMDAVVKDAIEGRMYNAGQACNSPKRFIILDDLYGEFIERMEEAVQSLEVVDNANDANEVGPVASRAAAENLKDQIDDAVGLGANLHAGGTLLHESAAFIAPTMLSGITPRMRAYHEELFGPAVVVYRVANEAEAIELANDSPYGLSCCIYSASPDRAIAVADQLDTGMAWINGISGTQADLPFGGVKKSGYGRELGRYGVLEFSNKKVFRVPAASGPLR